MSHQQHAHLDYIWLKFQKCHGCAGTNAQNSREKDEKRERHAVMTSEVCKGVLFGPCGHVSIVEEAGKAWSKSGYTAEDDGTVALGPSRRCLHPIEALYLTRRRSLLLIDATGTLQSVEASISALLPYVEYRVLAAYTALKDTGVAIRVVGSAGCGRDALHVYYTASAYKPANPGPPDDIVDVFS